MKTLLLTTLLCLAYVPAAAQLFSTQRAIVCGEADQILNALISELGEQPVWQGTGPDNNSRYMLLVSQDGQGWTLIQFNRQIACIIGAGENSTFLIDRLGSPI